MFFQALFWATPIVYPLSILSEHVVDAVVEPLFPNGTDGAESIVG